MTKSVGASLQRPGRRARAELPDAVEGQMVEICRDLAVQVKRMRQLQEQADELRVVIREWASQLDPPSDRTAASREGRR
jgi:hypothetical protein